MLEESEDQVSTSRNLPAREMEDKVLASLSPSARKFARMLKREIDKGELRLIDDRVCRAPEK